MPEVASAARWYSGATMVTRTQISLDPEIHIRAQKKAAQMGISLAEYFRKVIGRDLGEESAERDANGVFDLGRSDLEVVSENVDGYVGEAVFRDYESSSGTAP